MRLCTSCQRATVVFWVNFVLLPTTNCYKGVVKHEKWIEWLESPQPINNGYWLDYKNKPAWYFRELGESLVELFSKIETTHPLQTTVEQINKALSNNGPKGLATLTIEIIDGMRAVRRSEEGFDEADIQDNEANEFVTEGESVRMLTGQSLASDLMGNYAIPMEHARLAPQEQLDLALDSEIGFLGDTQRSLNSASDVLDDSALEKELFEKIEGSHEPMLRTFEVLMDQIINSPVELKIDIWETRTGGLFKTEVFVAIINLYKAVSGKVPLRDAEGLSYWLYNATSLSTDFIGDRVVKYNTQSKEDIRIAFEAIVRALDSVGHRLGGWLGNLEKVLVKKENIQLVRKPVVDLQLLVWAYRVNFGQLYKVVDEGIKLPSSFFKNR
ncbi:hypothetical protein TWF106_001440 [Orbilia oligospora]|uniref:Uncharacterized protein n=2 Tax=Orbilia oligospora TaxID=2813651 RepID=A0A7C8U8M9_ORBOL|nr:hypothetical protein TWF106_001440 [Orbilia oligospora]